MSELNQPAPPGKFLVDPYEEWAKGEGLPIHTGAAVDMLAAEVKPWARFGVQGAFCHLAGRDDFLTISVIELPPNSGSAPQQHLYEELCYVLTGRGATEVVSTDGQTRVIEWGPKSLFALPMNARYRHRNTSTEPARFAAVSDLRYLFNLYRSQKFIFETPRQFSERYEGLAAVADVGSHPAGPLTLAQGTISSDVVELPAGTYREAFRQMFGAHLLGVAGEGYMLIWEEGQQDYVRADWRHGVITATAGMRFRQQFNVGAGPARYLDIQLGSQVYPLFRHRRATYGDTKVYAAGNASIPRAEQDSSIHSRWLDAIAGKGIESRMA